MKKKLVCMITGCLLVMGMFVGCSGYSDENKVSDIESDELQPIFVEIENIERDTRWIVVYDQDTKVMYVVSLRSGYFTLLVDENGKPKLYKGE